MKYEIDLNKAHKQKSYHLRKSNRKIATLAPQFTNERKYFSRSLFSVKRKFKRKE